MGRTLEDELRAFVRSLETRRVHVRIEGGRAVPFSVDGREVPADVAETLSLVGEEAALAIEGREVGDGWRSRVASWPPWVRELWEERAAIREFDGLFPRALAELLAHGDVMSRPGRREPPPEPHTFRATAADGETWAWTADEMFAALDEAFGYVAQVRQGEPAEDTEAVQRLRDVVSVEAGPGALSRLVCMVGEAAEPEC
ncbi:MAG: hypothetical protein HZB55_21825 [Deltaproteobacteria bacterium]|nr:hypothetical protein [Deltaproteobacteria bacterium]